MVEIIENDIKEYFDYIKQIYLKHFDKILTEETKKQILKITSADIEYDFDLDYDIKVNDKIYYQLNIDNFIDNNNLLNENINELRYNEQMKIKYILNNKNNITKIIKDNMLENMILLFIPKKDIFAYGTCTFIANNLAKQYNLNSMNTYDKEAIVINELCNVFEKNEVLKCVINGNIELLENIYNQYCKDLGSNFKDMKLSFETEFNHYYKNKNKLYYIDSLYYYGNLNYDKTIKQIQLILNYKKQIEKIMSLRIESILDCIKELDRYIILLKEVDKNKLYYSSLNIKRLVEKNNNYLYYNEILNIEKELKQIVNYIWNYYVNFEGDYDINSNYWFLVQNYKQLTDDEIQVMHLITNEHLKVPQTKNRYKYGFIYKINTNAIIYSMPDSIIYRKIEENCQSNINTYEYNNKILEIEEQIYSSLLTPRNLLLKTLQNNKEYNDVLVDKNNVYRKAVYCICKSENDSDYMKALDLATKYDLPLIPLYESTNLSR